MKVKLSGRAIIHFSGIEVEADSVEAAIRSLDLDLINNPKEVLEDQQIFDGGLADEPTVDSMEVKYTVKCSDIEYDLTKFDLPKETLARLAFADDDEIDAAVEEFRATLPTELTVTVECDVDNLEDALRNELLDQTNCDAVRFKQTILKQE